jgi:hypothetical protein
MLIAILVVQIFIAAALGILLRRAYAVDPAYVVEQLDAAIGAIRDDIRANAGLTEKDVNLMVALHRMGRHQILDKVLPRLVGVCLTLDIEKAFEEPKRSEVEKAMVAQIGAELSEAAQEQAQ